MSGSLWSTWRGAVRPTRSPATLVWGDTPHAPRERGFAPLDSSEDAPRAISRVRATAARPAFAEAQNKMTI